MVTNRNGNMPFLTSISSFNSVSASQQYTLNSKKDQERKIFFFPKSSIQEIQNKGFFFFFNSLMWQMAYAAF